MLWPASYAACMQLDWIEDILAVIDTGSLARAAERRFLTQPAFTRRVRSIEERLGTPLFDRSRKPVTILPGVMAMEPELRELGARLRRLERDLKVSVERGGHGVTFVCQHALTTAVSPWIVRQLAETQDLPVRVRSGNADACLMQLLSGEADFAVTYDWPEAPGPGIPLTFESEILGYDRLVPVCAPHLLDGAGREELPAVTYPPDVFLGRVFAHSIAPVLAEGISLVSKVETALTLAACEYALDGIGVAWLPLTLVKAHIETGRLVQAGFLPDQKLRVLLVRLPGPHGGQSEAAWRHLTAASAVPLLS